MIDNKFTFCLNAESIKDRINIFLQVLAFDFYNKRKIKLYQNEIDILVFFIMNAQDKKISNEKIIKGFIPQKVLKDYSVINNILPVTVSQRVTKLKKLGLIQTNPYNRKRGRILSPVLENIKSKLILNEEIQITFEVKKI